MQYVDSMKALLTDHPVAVGIHGNTKDFLFYSGGSGPFQCENTPESLYVDHFMLLVGYLSPDYSNPDKMSWKLKNSFGLDWGINGYMELFRNDKNA
jgi:hypothetical protein